MTTALDFLFSFWRTIDENGSMAWTISDNHILILYYFNNENLDLQKKFRHFKLLREQFWFGSTRLAIAL